MEKENRIHEIPFPSGRSPVAREFSGSNIGGLPQKTYVHSQNLDQDATQNKGRI